MPKYFKPKERCLNKRLVTFLPGEDYRAFCEMAYQRNQHTAELLRDVLRGYLQPYKSGQVNRQW